MRLLAAWPYVAKVVPVVSCPDGAEGMADPRAGHLRRFCAGADRHHLACRLGGAIADAALAGAALVVLHPVPVVAHGVHGRADRCTAPPRASAGTHRRDERAAQPAGAGRMPGHAAGTSGLPAGAGAVPAARLPAAVWPASRQQAVAGAGPVAHRRAVVAAVAGLSLAVVPVRRFFLGHRAARCPPAGVGNVGRGR